MTNYENYKSEIEPIARMGRKVAIERDKNKIRACLGLKCIDCLFSDYPNEITCDEAALAWADAEYIEPEVDWSKVAVDTPILVRNKVDDEWKRRHFAKYDSQGGRVYVWLNGKTSYTSSNTGWWVYAKLAEADNE